MARELKRRILNVLISIDQICYVLITLGNGNPDETMSAAAYRLEKEDKWGGKIFRPILDAIFWFDPDHCRQSHERECYLK
jgi:hypothetical protein